MLTLCSRSRQSTAAAAPDGRCGEPPNRGRRGEDGAFSPASPRASPRCRCSAAHSTVRRYQTWPSAWRKSSSARDCRRARGTSESSKSCQLTIFDLRRMRCNARWPFSGTCQCKVLCLRRAAGRCARQPRRFSVKRVLCCTRRTLKCLTAFLHRRKGALHTGHRYTASAASSLHDSSPEPASLALPARHQHRRAPQQKRARAPGSASTESGAASSALPSAGPAASLHAVSPPVPSRVRGDRGTSAQKPRPLLPTRQVAGNTRGCTARSRNAVASPRAVTARTKSGAP